MTTFVKNEVMCANCGQSSEHQVLGSTNSFGSPDLDLRPPEMQRSTMRAWLKECPHCRYLAGDLSKAVGDLTLVAGDEYQAILQSQQFPDLAKRFLAHALLFLSSNSAVAGQSRLHAAWVCDDHGNGELARECRVLAADCLTRLEPFEDSEPGITQGAILVDILRRSGQFDRAYATSSELLRLQSAQGVLRQVLECQNRLIAQQDTSTHTVEECAG